MVEPRLPNFRVLKDVRLDNAIVNKRLNIGGVDINSPTSNVISSKIFNDQTYENVVISNLLDLYNVEITNDNTDEQWDAYRQLCVRIENSQSTQGQGINTTWSFNKDEIEIPFFIAMFSKTLNHDEFGRVVPSDYQLLRNGINERDVDKISSVPNPGNLKLVQPLGSFILNLIGPAPSSISIPASPSMSSAESSGEMVELYCKALLRDISFVDFDNNPVINVMTEYMNSLSDFKGPKPVTNANIFRGLGKGDIIGPYLSQLFFLDALMWPNTITSSINFPNRSSINNRMISSSTYLSVQNGNVTESGPELSNTKTYPSTGRDLSYIVWQDSPGYLYEIASKKALDAGALFSPINPYNNTPLNKNQESFITWSLTDLRSCLQTATQTGLTVAWYGKWVVNRRCRPESFGNEVEQWRLTGMTSNPAKIHNDLLTSEILQEIFSVNGNYYLPQTYPEGSPSHPSYPAGHAVVSGACITVMKAFFDEEWVFPNPKIPNSEGTNLTSIDDVLTLGGEINKMGSNVSLGRGWAGVHYRSDSHNGIIQGESVAKVVLQEWINRYPDSNVSFSFTGYMGDMITIKPQNSYGSNFKNFK